MKKLIELNKKKKLVEHQIANHKRKLHGDFINRNKQIIKFMDWVVIIIVLFNFGAITLTNTMVSKELHEIAITEDRKIEFLEVNPIVAKEQGLKLHPEAQRLINVAAIWLLKWTVLVWMYVNFRRKVYLERHLTLVIVILALWFIMLGMDFFNNFGLTLGKYFVGG